MMKYAKYLIGYNLDSGAVDFFITEQSDLSDMISQIRVDSYLQPVLSNMGT